MRAQALGVAAKLGAFSPVQRECNGHRLKHDAAADYGVQAHLSPLLEVMC